VYKLDSFVGFIGDEQLHAQECYDRSDFEIILRFYILLHTSSHMKCADVALGVDKACMQTWYNMPLG
jgi:hypothetical protein